MKQGWEYGTLEDAIKKGSSNISLNKIKDDEGDYPVFSAKGFAKNVSFFQQEQEYIAIIKDGAGIGRVAKYPAKSSVVATMQYLIPKKSFDIGFIEYFLNGINFEKHRSGSTIPHVYFKDYKSEAFPLIPLPEQKRIVEILDKAFVAIDKAKQNAEQNRENAKEMFQSKLQRIFDYGNKKWNETFLSNITVSITDGDHMPPPKTETGIPFITISNINKEQNTIDFSKTFKVPREYFKKIAEKRKPRKNDVLYTVTGSYGIPVLIELNLEFCFQRHIGLIRPKKSINSKWLFYWVLSPQAKKQADETSTGTAQKTVSLNALRNFLIPNMPIGEQKKIVQELDNLSSETKKLETIYQQKLDNLKELKKSIMQKAFRGEL